MLLLLLVLLLLLLLLLLALLGGWRGRGLGVGERGRELVNVHFSETGPLDGAIGIGRLSLLELLRRGDRRRSRCGRLRRQG